MTQKAFASSADLDEKERTLDVLADGVYALAAEGDPNVGAIEGEDFLVCFEVLTTPVAARESGAVEEWVPPSGCGRIHGFAGAFSECVSGPVCGSSRPGQAGRVLGRSVVGCSCGSAA
ncbi:hypothetical protein GCM10009676_06180 [Prauserella halophila]|uniref:Uncharacterized protein n=1 Tax=Prauserella halophila TaxID=185641 RepID=A0ABN1W114_9PSEU|nr:hypothetical protein [Prauserella halophila]